MLIPAQGIEWSRDFGILFFCLPCALQKKIGARARCRLLLKLFITENSQAACAQILNLTIITNKKRQPKSPF